MTLKSTHNQFTQPHTPQLRGCPHHSHQPPHTNNTLPQCISNRHQQPASNALHNMTTKNPNQKRSKPIQSAPKGRYSKSTFR
ncbi:hypothetical protein BJ508DRAFT_80700 [Ascobolus immersus RN42]|uniref:Uncharacterized protein n=1 Tax=Ascobolus immersus RN42 TaxID=1160509 RepID=A0A3N4I9V5_ASCIM|nr:hypothetical protein BJ508DRAFT_80700 [Ascobolus immersus RN42]